MSVKKLLLPVLLLFAFLPYVITCFYTLPFADDFCYGWVSAQPGTLIAKLSDQYLHSNGRVASNLLLLNSPLASGQLWRYQAAIFFMLLLIPTAWFALLKVLGLQTFSSFIASLFIVLFFLCYQPQITEGVYWFTGASTYLAGALCFVGHLAVLLIAFKRKGLSALCFYALSAVLLALSMGFNETGAAIIISYYLLASIIMLRYKNEQSGLVLGLSILAFAIFCFVLLAPGNSTRSSQFAARFNLFHSLFYALAQTARFIGTWVFEPPFLLLSVLVVFYSDVVKPFVLLWLEHWLVLVLAIYTVFVAAFMPYFGTGILGQHRTINYSLFLFIPLWCWWLIIAAEKFGWQKKLQAVLNPNRAFAVAVLCSVLFFVSGNGKKLMRDFSSNTFKTYRQSFDERQQMILVHPDRAIHPLITIPSVFQITDARADSSWWVDKCMQYFYAETKRPLQ